MSIKDDLAVQLRGAMRNRDKPRLNVIRQVQTEVSIATTARGFSGAIDDDLYVKVIAGYVKKMESARKEFEAAGERGAGRAASLAYEVEYLSQWLPTKLDEAATRDLVRTTIHDLGADDPKQTGRVTGAMMRSGAELDGSLVARIVREELGA